MRMNDRRIQRTLPNARWLVSQLGKRHVGWMFSAACLFFAVVASASDENAVARDRAARPLPLSAVRLTGGPLKHAQDLDAEYLLELEPDRMLAYYRQRAGLEPKAEPYGGWDGGGRNLTGHIAGHYLSAVSLMWAATGDDPLQGAGGLHRGRTQASAGQARRRVLESPWKEAANASMPWPAEISAPAAST